MPRKMFMSWTGDKHRWRKMYKGRVYTVFCSELDLPNDRWTELDSYQAANEWWVAKRAEIDGRAGRKSLPPDAESIVGKLKQKVQYAEREGLGNDAAIYAGALHEAEQQVEQGDYDLPDVDPKTLTRLRLLEQLGFTVPADLDPTTLDAVFGAGELWADRLRRDKVVALSKRVGKHLDDWYRLVHRRAKPSSVTNIHGYYQQFKDLRSEKAVVLHESMDVAVLNEDRFAEVFRAIDTQKLSPATKKKKWAYFKQFVTYLAEKGLIPLPKNFRSKLLVFRTPATSKAAPDPVAVREFLDTLPDRLKLYALLALNCGMNNVDIGKMRPGEVDWAKRTVTRKRHKTEDSERVPTVRYTLWEETFRLLTRLRSKSGDLLLLSEAGEPLYLDGKVGDKATLYDRIKSQWRDHFKRGRKKPYTLKEFRFFGADLLKESVQFRSYRDPFLGHAPRSTGDKSYSSVEDVSAACRYLEGLFYREQA